jgi:hypothetical protein
MGDLQTALSDFLSAQLVNSHFVTLDLDGGTVWVLTSPAGSENLVADPGDPGAAKLEADGELLSAGYKRATLWRDGEPFTAIAV